MTGEFVSRQLSFLPENLIEEAMKEASRRQKTLYRVLRAAACLAVVIGILAGIGHWNSGVVTNPGILAVTVYAEDASSTTLSPDTVLPYSYYWGMTEWAPGLPITLSVSDADYISENITFQVTVDGGGFYVGVNGGTSIYPGASKPMPARFTIPNHTTIFWSAFSDASGNDDFIRSGQVAYADIIIYDDTEIIGYTVLRLDRESPDSIGFAASMLASVSFPASQAVTEEYVYAQIEKVKSR
ncbi:MAG: hypothetical protein ACI4PO_10620 [Faecousia sp.]